MTASVRQRWSSVLRLAVCAAAISWIVWNTKWAKLADVWRGADKWLLLLSVLVALLKSLILLRWMTVLRWVMAVCYIACLVAI